MRSLSVDFLCKGKTISGEWITGYPIFKDAKSEIYSDQTGQFVEVDPQTVRRFTGKWDCKDNMIFENDILCEVILGTKPYYLVEYDRSQARWSLTFKRKSFNFRDFNPTVLVIVGNSYDNPEMIDNETEAGTVCGIISVSAEEGNNGWKS